MKSINLNIFWKLCKVVLIAFVVFFIVSSVVSTQKHAEEKPLWQVQSIDTMKYSRDVSREKLNDPTFDIVIAQQVKAIAATGATHVAVATPYDEEFLPILKRWVAAVRRNNISVWFRGNWSGWEGWFGYERITRDEHFDKTKAFIFDNPDLFEDGDIFTACPECENGGPGDPRMTGDVEGFRSFLIREHDMMDEAFDEIGKNVTFNYNSMNGDVGRLIMDKDTTKALGGVVVIDHYVRTAEQLVDDIEKLSESSGGMVVLGEFGAPISDIHGQMSPEEQAAWLEEVLSSLVPAESFLGMNYWTNVGGSTEIFTVDGAKRPAAETLTSFYSPRLVALETVNPLGDPIKSATITTLNRTFVQSGESLHAVPLVEKDQRVTIKADGYETSYISIDEDQETVWAVLEPTETNILYKIRFFFNNFFSKA